MHKIRTQIQLDPSDYLDVKRYAREHGLSLAGAIRVLVRRGLSPAQAPADAWDDFLGLAGIGRDPEGGPVGRDHNRYLYGES